jgi:hypothetical protein
MLFFMCFKNRRLKMRLFSFSVILCIGIISIAGRAFSQGTNLPGTIMWPSNPPVGIGTQVGLPMGPQNALQINFDSAHRSTTMEAIIRLSNANGGGTASNTFGILGLMTPFLDSSYSTLSKAQDLILHEHQGGDIIITNFWPGTSLSHQTGGSIRLATAGDTDFGMVPADSTLWKKDYERVTIMTNGNVGIDVPPDTATGLDSIRDQFQIGGGSRTPPGYSTPIPGLSFYGGYPYEGLPILGGGTFPLDWRGISFNQYKDHVGGYSSRFAPMSSWNWFR